MHFIADESILFHSPAPQDLYCYTPWLEKGFNGRLFASFDIAGKGLVNEDGPKTDHGDYGSNQFRIYISDDRGYTWQPAARLAMLHTRIFTAGQNVYALGHSGRLVIAKSTDNGNTWSEPTVLDPVIHWHQSGGSIERANGRIYLTMEHSPDGPGWAGGDPILMSAYENDDLTKIENWTFSNKLEFKKIVGATSAPGEKTPHCWLESSVAFQRDKSSFFYDPDFRSMLLFLRVNAAMFPNIAMVVKGTEKTDGSLELSTLKTPDGKTVLYCPFPGGYMKFQIVWDEPSKLYWLIASQSRYTTFTDPEKMDPCMRWANERRHLELFYSRNLFDWCSAGVIACGNTELESRHYASLLIIDNDLLVLSRSGDTLAKDTHDTDMITLHRVKNFRDLA